MEFYHLSAWAVSSKSPVFFDRQSVSCLRRGILFHRDKPATVLTNLYLCAWYFYRLRRHALYRPQLLGLCQGLFFQSGQRGGL